MVTKKKILPINMCIFWYNIKMEDMTLYFSVFVIVKCEKRDKYIFQKDNNNYKIEVETI